MNNNEHLTTSGEIFEVADRYGYTRSYRFCSAVGHLVLVETRYAWRDETAAGQ